MIFHLTSKKPIVIAGNGVRQADAVEKLHDFYQKTKIPVLTTMNAVDLMQNVERIGFVGVYGNRIANMIVAHSDLVISIGARLGLRQIGNKKEYFAPEATLIRADIDQSELSRDIKNDEAKYQMDADTFLSSLLGEEIPEYVEWNQRCFKAKELIDGFDKDIGNLCIEKISEILPENPIIAVDVGQNQCWAAQSLSLKGEQGRILISGGYGSMGCGLPLAIGASIANRKKTAICITGDGGMQMNIQELQTIVGEQLPVKIMVLNNQSLGKITEIQTTACDSRYHITTKKSGYTVPDFEKIALAYGIRSKTLNDYEDVIECKEWIWDEEACLINIMLPEYTTLQPKMNWNEREMKPTLDTKIMGVVNNLLDGN